MLIYDAADTVEFSSLWSWTPHLTPHHSTSAAANPAAREMDVSIVGCYDHPNHRTVPLAGTKALATIIHSTLVVSMWDIGLIWHLPVNSTNTSYDTTSRDFIVI